MSDVKTTEAVWIRTFYDAPAGDMISDIHVEFAFVNGVVCGADVDGKQLTVDEARFLFDLVT